jgi:hypothetical protein
MNGQCFCGAVTFQVTPPTDFVSHCHCRSCRLSHGAPMVTWTSVPPDRFLLKSGQDQLRSYASSPEVEWQFCGHCGSSLFYRASYTPDKVYVAAACLDELDQPPDSHVSFEEHLPWFDPAAPLPRYRGKSSEPV